MYRISGWTVWYRIISWGFIPGEDQVTLSAATVVWPQTCNAPSSAPAGLSDETLALVSFTRGVPGTWNKRQNAALSAILAPVEACWEQDF